MADWDSMGGVITETRGRAFQTLGQAISFLLNPQKLGRVFKARLSVSKAPIVLINGHVKNF